MSKPYDATIKDLAAVEPADFVSWFDGPTSRPVTVLNVDLSTVTTAADVVFGIGDPMTEILHLDAQAGASATKHLDVLAYNVLLHRQYGVPVHSCVLLLRSQAEHPNMTGRVEYAARPQRGKLDFGFEVIRQLAERLEHEATGDQADRLLVAAYILTGLRLKSPDEVRQLFQGASIAMRESVTYQAILEEGEKIGEKRGEKIGEKRGWRRGRIRELHRVIVRLGRVRFGEPDEAIMQQIKVMRDIERLEDLSERLLIVSSWDELMA